MQSLSDTGSNSGPVTRGRWDPDGFAAQTPAFVTGTEDGFVRFGYVGQRTADVAEGIRVADVRWLHSHLGRISDDQIRAALTASGADEPESDAFTRAIRARVDQLGAIASGFA